MNKKRNFAKLALLGVLLCGVAGPTFVGCKDYDDDIKDLQEQIDANKSATTTEISSAITKQVSDLETKLNAAIENKADASTIQKLENEIVALKGLQDRIATLEKEASNYLTASALEGFLTTDDLSGYLKEDALVGYLKEDALDQFLKDHEYVTKEDIQNIPTEDVVRTWLATEILDLNTLIGNYNDFQENTLPNLLTKEGVEELESDLEELTTKVNGLETLVNALNGRIQSLAFIPVFEGVQPLYYFAGEKAGDDNIFGVMTFRFRVSPAAIAEKIKKEELSFLFEEALLSRSGVPVSVAEVAADNGMLTVKVNATDFEGKHPMALAVNNGSDNLTSDYFVVETAEIDKTSAEIALQGKATHNIPYTQSSAVNVTEDHIVLVGELNRTKRDLSTFGFSKKLVLTHINDLEIDKAKNEEKIETYRKENKLELTTDAEGNIFINIKKDEVNKIENINKASFIFTLKDETTGVSLKVEYKIAGATSEANDVKYELPEDIIVEEGEDMPSMIWAIASQRIVHYLQLDEIDNISIAGIEKREDKLKILGDANLKYEVSVDNGLTWEEANTKTTPYLHAQGGKSIRTVIPEATKWQDYLIRTTFETANYGDFVIEAHLPLSYPLDDVKKIAGARWMNQQFGTYFMELKAPTTVQYVIANDLRAGFLNATILEEKGMKYKFELVNTIDSDEDGEMDTYPAGVTLEDAQDGNADVLTFIKKADLSKVLIKTVVEDGAGNVVYEFDAFSVNFTKPVNVAFEEIKAVNLTFKKADIIAGKSFNPWRTVDDKGKVTQVLQLKDFQGSSLMEIDATSNDVIFAKKWNTIYGVGQLAFELANVPDVIDPKNIAINETTGEITLNEKNLTVDVNIQVKVSASNLFGTSESIYTVKLEKTINE